MIITWRKAVEKFLFYRFRVRECFRQSQKALQEFFFLVRKIKFLVSGAELLLMIAGI